jgi:hypothetical protein
MIHQLILCIVVLIVAGIIYYAFSALVPIPQPFKNLILLAMGLIVFLILLEIFGVGIGDCGNLGTHYRGR